MENILLSRRNIQKLVILITVTSIICIVWYYEKSVKNQHIFIGSLQEQLLAQQHSNQYLTENLSLAQKNWQVTESELRDMIGRDLENKFEQSQHENEFLKNQITQLQYYHDVEISRLERARIFLVNKSASLQESHTQFADVQNELEHNITELKSEIAQHKKTIAGLESENKQHKKLIASLQKPVETKPEPDAIQTAINRPADNEEDKSDNYRHVRIQSLINAMQNHDSVARKNILVSVIPTIPNGVSISEFLSLISGMESEDILAAIRLTNKNIARPLDSQTISTLIGKMNAQDAEAANVIFNTNE
jgi:hypothetical protein